MINVADLTLQYHSGKGVFDLNFTVKTGEIVGYLGPNGAGKTTTIRCLMGFMRADQGKCTIDGLDCFTQAPKIQKNLGYIPGEIAFPDGLSGVGFLRLMSDLRGTKDLTRQHELIEMFELDPRGAIKKFSKGMKQKIGIVAAFMHDPAIYILDEPTSGLDPLMQNRFVDLILTEKKRGKTILMSSHMFEEVERTTDRVLVIKDGRIVAQDTVQRLKDLQQKNFIVTLKKVTDAKFFAAKFPLTKIDNLHVEISVPGDQLEKFLSLAAKIKVTNLQSKIQSLEEVFLNFYDASASS